MTWTKLSDDFGEDCARVGLTDAPWRTHVEGLLWANRRETDGFIAAKDLKRFAEVGDPIAAVQALIEVGFWEVVSGGWRIVHAQNDQVERAVLAKRRADANERARKSRHKKLGLDGSATLVTSNVTRDSACDPGRDRAGQVGKRTRRRSGDVITLKAAMERQE